MILIVFVSTPKLTTCQYRSSSKRGMNGDIILRKLKLAPAQIASMVENMDCSQLDSVELRTLYEFMPTEDERKGLTIYLENSKSRFNAIADLTPCEQFMVAMKELTDSEEKFQCMIFISEFQGKMAELKWDVSHLSAACKELRASNRFKMLLAMILTLVNKINSIGEDDAAIAHGFSLDSLSKLGEVSVIACTFISICWLHSTHHIEWSQYFSRLKHLITKQLSCTISCKSYANQTKTYSSFKKISNLLFLQKMWRWNDW